MHVGHHLERVLPAKPPERAIAGSVEDDDAGVEAVRIEVVIVDEAVDPPPFSPPERESPAHEKGPRLVLALSAAPEFGQPGVPNSLGAGESVSRRG
jgi:hypothetical protein